MEENPYKSPLASANPPGDEARRALALWLVVLSGWMWFVWGPLTVYFIWPSSPAIVVIEDTIIVLLYAILPIWIVARVRRGQGIKATRYLLLGMIPFVAGELAAPFFALRGITSAVVVFLIIAFGHVCCYVAAWRCVIRLESDRVEPPSGEPS
jgi:hypothetical protein